MNSYLYHTVGQKLLGNTIIIPLQFTQDFQDLDDLYYQVSELYKEATGKTPPIRRDVIVNNQPVRIKHDINKPSLILITTPQNAPHELIIDPATEMTITIYFP
jgi:hypothetical protein